MTMPRLTAVVLWALEEVQKLEDLDFDHGWWISAALKETKPGDRLVIYQTKEDQGVVALFDVATKAFLAGELGYAAYGRPTRLDKPIPIRKLQRDVVLGQVFGKRQGRFYLDSDQRGRLEALLPSVPWARSKDAVPEPGDPDWEWQPMDRWWGSELDASSAIAEHPSAWRRLGFGQAPERERSPHSSLDRTDLKGRDRHGNGIIAEVKHFVAMRTLEQQLDRYLREARAGGGL
jgi:hypothetical protein